MATIVCQLSGSTKNITVAQPVLFNFDYDYDTNVWPVSSYTPSLSTLSDRIFNVSGYSLYGSLYVFNTYQTPRSLNLLGYSLSSSNTSVALVTSWGSDNNAVIYKSNGTVSLAVSALFEGNRVLTKNAGLFSFTSSTESATVSYLSAVAGTVRLNVEKAIDDRIASKSATTAKSIFTTQNHGSDIYVRNTDCWAYDLDLTCISPWNSMASNQRAGVLITPRHILFAAHYEINANSTIRFVRTDNTSVTRTMTRKRTHPQYSPYYPDITIGLLDSDVPSGINFCRILPNNWETYLPTGIKNIPCLLLDQEEKALIADGNLLTSTYTNYQYPTNSKRLEFSENVIGGDSGNPSFLIINNQLVLLTVFTYGGPGQGTSITPQRTIINQMIRDIDTEAGINTGYSLTDIDLSSFVSF
jgi:hypothetical protein